MVFTSNILVSILPCVAYDNDKARILLLQRNKIKVLCGVCNSQCFYSVRFSLCLRVVASVFVTAENHSYRGFGRSEVLEYL